MRAAENWSRSNSYSDMFPSKRPNGTSGASGESAPATPLLDLPVQMRQGVFEMDVYFVHFAWYTLYT